MNIEFAIRKLSCGDLFSLVHTVKAAYKFETQMVVDWNSVCEVTDLGSQHVHIVKINQSLSNGLPSTREGPTLFHSQYN